MILKIHLNRRDRCGGARTFGINLQADTFSRLNAQCENIRTRSALGFIEQHTRSAIEVDVDFGTLPLEMLTASQVEGDSVPPPVINGELHSGVGFGLALRGNAAFLKIADDGLALLFTPDILPANCHAFHLFRRVGNDGF